MSAFSRNLAIFLSMLVMMPGCLGDELAGEPIPDYSMRADDGNTYTKEGMDGQKYLIQFTASWCPRCFKTMHNITGAISDVEFLVVSTDESDYNKLAQWHNDANNSNSSKNLDIPFMVGSELAEELSIDAMPTIVLIDKNGYLVASHEGDLTSHDEITKFWNSA